MPSSAEDRSSSAANGRTKASGDSSQAQEQHGDVSPQMGNAVFTKAKHLWAKTGITLPVLKLMVKGAVAPTIAIAAYQSDAWSSEYTTLGYLIGIITQLSVVIQPRAKFLQTMLVQILLICFGTALTVLACFSIVHARIGADGVTEPGTGGPGTSGTASQGAQTAPYSSSASAVAGVWLFVEIYGISALRANFPQYTLPCVMFAIMANVSMTYAPQFSTMVQAEAFCVHLMSAFLTGFAISTAVELLIFPVTSRELLFNDMRDFITGLQACLSANMTYLNSLEETDMFAAQKTNSAGQKPPRSPEAEAFLTKMKAVSATHSKCATNLTFAKREVALGKLGPDDLQQIFKLLREMTVPLVGLSTLSDIFERISQESGWDRSKSFAAASSADAANVAEKARIDSINEWHELIRLLQEPFASLTEVIDGGLQHVLITLQLLQIPRARAAHKEETGDIPPQPGDRNFAAYLKQKAEEFNKSKQLMLREWLKIHGVELPDDYFSNADSPFIELPHWMNGQTTPERVRLRRQLMVLLYVESMLYILSRRTLNTVNYADSLRDSKLTKTRLIVPGIKRLRKWLSSTLQQQDIGRDEHFADSFAVRLGQGYEKRKDPEHLPPQNAWEKATNIFRGLARFFGSSASMFGFRVAVATMSIAIVSLLKDSQIFATKERLFWAQIMTSIAMAPSAGQSLRTFLLRVLGTILAMIQAMIAWYIVTGHAAGVLVFYFILQLPGLYIMIKKPTLIPVGMISTVTLTLILGYELQVQKIGVKLAESNGQLYHPTYELGPIRLLTVISGLFAAWIFTVFPYPVTEHSELRRNTAKSFYLLASYYSAVNETVKIRLKGGDETVKESPAQKLAKARLAIFSKCNMLLSGMRSQTAFIKYDIPCGGRFPKKQYEELIERVQNILSFVSLVSVASASFTWMANKDAHDSQYEWVRNLRKLLPASNVTSQSVTTLLCLLSASLGHGLPLPPYLRTPSPYGLTEKLEEMDSELLSIRHIAEPGYASFAVIQIGLTCMIDDLRDLLDQVKSLVGELDFSINPTIEGHSQENWQKED